MILKNVSTEANYYYTKFPSTNIKKEIIYMTCLNSIKRKKNNANTICTYETFSKSLFIMRMSHPLFLRVRMNPHNDKAVIYNYILYYIQENYTL